MSPRVPTPRHLVVRLPNPLGDAVMAVPALRALRSALPDARITWAGGRAAHGALEGLPYRDDVMPAMEKDADGKRVPLRAGRVLRRLGADAALLLPNSFSSALAVRRAGIAVRVGSDLHARGGLLTHPVGLPKARDGKLVPRSMVEMYLDLAAAFGARDDGRGLELATTPFDEERTDLRLRNVPAARPLLGINPGAAFGATKIYPPARILDAVGRIRAQVPAVPVVLCGPGEEDLGRAIADGLEPPFVACHAAVPDLGELKAILRRCAVLLTTDTGPRHVAEALGVPTVVWMGPTDPRWSAHSSAHVLRVEGLACLGCHQTTCAIGLPCMETLEPGRVAEAALIALTPR